MSPVKRILFACAVVAGIAGHVPLANAQTRGEARTALVIGNGAYSFGKLANPTNDARDIAEVLRGAGFEVILKTDADQGGMKDAIRSFGSALKTKGGVGMLFYAGHGVQSNGENYILPIGDGFSTEADLKSKAIAASEAVDAMSAARNALNIVVLDACRDNPLPGSQSTRGLSRVDSSSSLFVSFSTSPGETALDGSGRNSPYTKHLTRSIATPNIAIEDTFKRTLKGVYQETGGKQQPWISSSFFGEFMFKPGASPPAALPTPPQQAGAVGIPPRMVPGGALVPGTAPALAGIYYAEGTNPNGSRYRGMVALTPAGNQYRFTWWIGKQIYTGVGQFAGRMLVVNWGQKKPVIYSFAHGDNLDGEWADGSATEKLTLVARAATGTAHSPEGDYVVAGTNPNGTRYRGAVSISRQGSRYQLDWRVGQSSYRGIGTLDGNVLVVNWGSTTPVIYSLGADGTLSGLWAAGHGSEILTPSR